jgi:hypothetical protein
VLLFRHHVAHWEYLPTPGVRAIAVENWP